MPHVPAQQPQYTSLQVDATATQEVEASTMGQSTWFSKNPFSNFSFTGAAKATPPPGSDTERLSPDSAGEAVPGAKARAASAPVSPAKKAKTPAEIKEEELARREEELRRKEAAIQEQARRNNPRIPNFPICWPLMYHNIKLDIPAQSQTTMNWMFRNFCLMMICLLVNMLACFSVMTAHVQNNTTGSRDFGVSIMYLIGLVVAAFFLWYRPVYNAYRKDSSMLFYFFFFCNGWHILFVFYMAIGVPGSGSAGIINAINVVTDHQTVAGMMCSISAATWLLHGLLSLYLYKRTHRYYRVRGLTADDAKNEAVKGVASTGIMQGVAGAYMKSNTAGMFV